MPKTLIFFIINYPMKTLSVCMIVRNEEAKLESLLQSVLSFADELIIVDTGSMDHTVDIAKKYTKKVFSFPWIDDFSKARNFSIDQATSDYFMWLDADDKILPSEQKKLRTLKRKLTKNMYLFPYCLLNEKNEISLMFYRERIMKNIPRFRFQGVIHEAIPLDKNISYESIPIYHQYSEESHTARNLKILENLKKERLLSSRELYYYGRELMDGNDKKKACTVFEEYLIRSDTWPLNAMDACLHLYYLYKEIHEDSKANQKLFQALSYGYPNADVLVTIGQHFYEKKDYKTAKFYFKLCLKIEKDPLIFTHYDAIDFLPHLYLALIAYQEKDYSKAIKENLLALKYKPQDPYALKNHEYYTEKLHSETK